MQHIYLPTAQDRAAIRKIASAVVRRPINTREGFDDYDIDQSVQQSLMALLPPEGLQMRGNWPSPEDVEGVPDTMTVRGADCDIYTIDAVENDNIQSEEDPPFVMKLVPVSGYTEKVYNPYRVAWYGNGSGEGAKKVFINIHQLRNGIWVCEAPQFYHKVRPTQDVDVGETVLCDVIIGGVEFDIPQQIPVALDWMASADPITQGKEASARYLANEDKWMFDGAECET